MIKVSSFSTKEELSTILNNPNISIIYVLNNFVAFKELSEERSISEVVSVSPEGTIIRDKYIDGVKQ